MWKGKKKALTFSFDDGVKQDLRLIELFNKYGLKGTFNINSDLLGKENLLWHFGMSVSHDKVTKREVRERYVGHEVAVHTLTHPNLTTLEEKEIVRQVEKDRKALSKMCGYEVVGMAYPCGGVNNDDRTAKIIAEKTGVKYARTITSTDTLDVARDNLYRFDPTCHILQDNINEIVDEFLSCDGEEERLLYIWGHSYELDGGAVNPNGMDWEKFEAICKKLSGKADIYYATNAEILL